MTVSDTLRGFGDVRHENVPVAFVSCLLGDNHVTSNTVLWYVIVFSNAQKQKLVFHCAFHYHW